MTKDELKELGVVQKKGRKGTRFLLKTKDSSGKDRYVTLHITDKSTKKEISTEIQKARIKLKKDMLPIKNLIAAWHEARGHADRTVCASGYALSGITLDPDGDKKVCMDIITSDLAASSKNLYIRLIHGFFSWLISTGHTCIDPTVGLAVRRVYTPRSRTLTDGEITHLLDATSHDHDARLALLIMLHTGCRKSSAALVRPSDWDGSMLHMYNRKRGRPFAVPLSDPETIRMVCEGYRGGAAAALHRLYRTMHAMGPDAAGEYISPHTLRHTWATRAIRAGVPLDVISRTLDHSSIGVTLAVYARHSPEQIADAVSRVDATIPKKG